LQKELIAPPVPLFQEEDPTADNKQKVTITPRRNPGDENSPTYNKVMKPFSGNTTRLPWTQQQPNLEVQCKFCMVNPKSIVT